MKPIPEHLYYEARADFKRLKANGYQGTWKEFLELKFIDVWDVKDVKTPDQNQNQPNLKTNWKNDTSDKG